MKEIVSNPPIALATSRTTFPCPLAPHNTKSSISPRLGWAAPELRHRGMPRLRDAVKFHNLPQRLAKDVKVKLQTPVIDVPQVEVELLRPAQLVSAIDLGPAGDSGQGIVPPHLLCRVAIEILRQEGTRPNQA